LPYRVERQLVLSLPPLEVWQFLTRPELITDWFADCFHMEPGDPFIFDFGDGDFFAGDVVEWVAPEKLHLQWKFAGIGPRFDIVFTLQAANGATILTVTDTGSMSVEEAEGLTEGWADFLSRLESRVRTGEPARYRWSQTIGIAALLDEDVAEVRATVFDPAWLEASFGGSATVVSATDRELRLRFRGDSWRGSETAATVTLDRIEGKTYLGVVHTGWTELPEAQQIAERARFAMRWRDALGKLESKAVVAKA
jgi:uncharacterized protein YndB with AHSA1/START domain